MHLTSCKTHGGKLVEVVKKEIQKREEVEKQNSEIEDKLSKATLYGSKMIDAHKEESAKRREAEDKIKELEEKLLLK